MWVSYPNIPFSGDILCWYWNWKVLHSFTPQQLWKEKIPLWFLADIDFHLTWMNLPEWRHWHQRHGCNWHYSKFNCQGSWHTFDWEHQSHLLTPVLTSGGCDGCLNIHDPDNKGLEGVIADLEQVYQDESFEDILSRYSLVLSSNINTHILSLGLTCGLCWVFGQFKKVLTETMRTASGK